MKSNWSKKAQESLQESKFFREKEAELDGDKVFFDESFSINLGHEYPFKFSWQGEQEELLVLMMSLLKLSEQMPWQSWTQLKVREVENYLRDMNHLAAIPMESLDSKKVEFFLEILFQEHFKLRLSSFLQRQNSPIPSDYLAKHKYFDSLFNRLSLLLNGDQAAGELILLYQITQEEVVIRVKAELLQKFHHILTRTLEEHFSHAVKIVAIDI